MIIPERLLKEEQIPIMKKLKKVNHPKTLKQKAGENIEMNDKALDKDLAKKMINPYYFIDEDLKIGFEFNLESHIIHANSINHHTILSRFRY